MRDWKTMIARRLAQRSSVDAATEIEIVEELAEHFVQREKELQYAGFSSESIDMQLEQELNELDLEALIAIRRHPKTSLAPLPTEGRPTISSWLDGLVRDIVVGYRSLRRTSGVTAVIALSLAVVLGANTAIFSITDAMYLRRLDLPDPDQLVRVDVLRDGRLWDVPYSAFRDLTSAPSLPKIAGFRFEPVIATTANRDEQRLWLHLVTGEYFDLVGVKPLVGRVISPSDEASRAPVVVVSEEFWRQHLGARSDALGQTLRLNDKLFTIVGVMPERFRGLFFAHRFQVAAPFSISVTGFPDLRILSTTIVSRLDRLTGREAQRTALDAAVRACCANQVPMNIRDGAFATNLPVVQVDDPPYREGSVRGGAPAGLSVQLVDASRGLTWGRDLRGRYESAMLLMIAGALLLLLVVCANVATLLLARGEWRAREFAIRRSLGASLGRVRRQLFIEALEVSLFGGALGLFFAWLITTLLSRALPSSAHALGDVIAWRPNARLVGVTVAITALCAISSSLWPARRAGREELTNSLAGARARRSSSWTGQRVLAIGQICVSMVLITAAWLFVATTRNLTRGAGGYGSRDVVIAQISARALRDSGAGSAAAIEELRQDLRHLPGVVGAAYSYSAPLMQDALMLTRIELRGATTSGPMMSRVNHVSSDFFEVSGGGIARGRDFTRSDDMHSDLAIVSESFERHYYPGRSAVGMTFDIVGGPQRRSMRIVGIARNARYDRMRSSSVDLRNSETEMIYMPFARLGSNYPLATVIIRSDLSAATTIQQLRRVVDQHAGVSLDRVTTVGAWLDDGASRERFSGALATSFGALAVLLSAIGVLGVLAFQVAHRRREIGVRMALGAQRSDTVFLVMRQTFGMLGIAVAIGAPCAITAAWVVRSQLYGIAPWDPRAVLAAVSVVLTAGLVASAVPSYRAARVDPLVALRDE